MNNFKRVSAAALAGATLVLASGTSHGMGFGRPVSRAILGEPLRVSVPLRLEAGETLEANCVQVEVHFGESQLSSSQVQVSVVGGSGREATVQVRTTTPITEPIVTYELTAGCQAKIKRQFVALADPPGMTRPVSPVTAPVSETSSTPVPDVGTRAVAPTRADAPSQGVATAPATRASRDPAKRTSRTARATSSPRGSAPAPAVRPVTEADEIVSPRTSLSLTPKAAAAVVPAAERLVLDPVEADAAARPDLRMSGSLDTLASVGATDEPASPEVQARRAAAAALWQAMNLSPEEIARDRQKLIAQEQMLAQLQQQASQPRAAEPTSPAQPAQAGEGAWLLYLVGALALIGLGLCVALFMKLRRRQQEEAAWWQSQMQEPQGEAPAAVSPPATPAAAPSVPAAVSPQAVKAELPKSDIERASVHATTVGAPAAAASPRQAPKAVTPPAPPATPARQTALEATREVSVEELIDLEQQADFFVVLGQDDAALDLLESHVHAVSASPLPFLKLLEIYQRLGKRADYERIQQAFNQRFNAHAPAWDADLQHGHELVDYPGVVERLQSLWPVPAKAMEVLEKSLTHPENEADTFELPAYRELLFLYAVARDLSEREIGERPSVDLLARELPTHQGTRPFDLTTHEDEVEPLMATRPIKAVPAVQPTLSLDLQLDDLALEDKPRSSYGDVTVSDKGVAANEQDVEHIDLPGLSELDVDLRSGAHKP